jgi:hypothetical protein
MFRKINAFAAALATTATLAVAAEAAQAQPNTGDPVHDGYCAALEDQAREAAGQLFKTDSAMTNRYWNNRLSDAHRKAREERCEWYEGGAVDSIEPRYPSRFLNDAELTVADDGGAFGGHVLQSGGLTTAAPERLPPLR